MKKRIYIDLDDTIADFADAIKAKHSVVDNFTVYHMYEEGFFENLKPIEGSLSGVRALIRLGYDVQILTQPLAESAHSYSEKVKWVGIHFPDLIDKVNMTQDKGLFIGDYLIDDNAEKWRSKFEANGGMFVHFGHGEFSDWHKIVCYFSRLQATK